MTREDAIMTLVVNHMLNRNDLEEVSNEVLLDYMKYFHEECDGIEDDDDINDMPTPRQVAEQIKIVFKEYGSNFNEALEIFINKALCFDQIQWEHDVMELQLKEIGLSLGEKTDEVKEAIKYYNKYHNNNGKEAMEQDAQKLCSNCVQSAMCYRYNPLFPKRAENCFSYELARYLL